MNPSTQRHADGCDRIASERIASELALDRVCRILMLQSTNDKFQLMSPPSAGQTPTREFEN